MLDKPTTVPPSRGGTYLRCKAPGCDAFVLFTRHKRKMPYGDAKILGIRANNMLLECGACHAVTSWWLTKSIKVKQEKAAEFFKLRPEILRGATYPSTDDIVPLMEARWAEFSRAKLRERGRVASGLRFDVFVRDDFRCRYCGLSADDGAILHADHVIAESKGGPTTLDNLVTACLDCNLGKSDKALPETAPVLR